MLKKTLILVVAALVGSSLLFAQQTRKGPADGPVRQKKPKAQKQNQPAPFGRILNALNKAYRQNDREQMGIILRKLNQAHKKMQGQIKDTAQQHKKWAQKPGMQKKKAAIIAAKKRAATKRPGGEFRQNRRMPRGRQGQGRFRDGSGRQGPGPQMHGMCRQRQGRRGPRMRGRGRVGRAFGRRGRGYSGQGQYRFRQDEFQW